MRKILVDSIKGNEKLAKDIYNNRGTLLMPEGITIKKSYVEKLKELQIDYIYVNDEISKGIDENQIIENQIKLQCADTIRDIMERCACDGNAKFGKTRDVVNDIITDMLAQPEIVYNISGVRQKSEEIYAHSLNVCALSVLLALRMRLPKPKVYDIAVGAVLHDIGYCNVPVDIRTRNPIDYSEAERKEMKMHVVYGYSMLEDEEWLSHTAKDIVFQHHERLDGSGYPLHLTGNRIGMGSKIVAVSDAFDNIVYGNYELKLKVHEAIEYIVAKSSSEFDRQVVDIFSQSVAAYPNGTIVITSMDDVGIVLRQNSSFPTRPVIRLLKKSDGVEYSSWVEKDLVKELSLFIKDTIENY